MHGRTRWSCPPVRFYGRYHPTMLYAFMFFGGIVFAVATFLIYMFVMVALESRTTRIRERVWQELGAEHDLRLKAIKDQAAASMEALKTDPVAMQTMKSLEGMVERIVMRKEATIHWPADLPPEVISSLLKAIVAGVDFELQSSKEIHKALFDGS